MGARHPAPQCPKGNLRCLEQAAAALWRPGPRATRRSGAHHGALLHLATEPRRLEHALATGRRTREP